MVFIRNIRTVLVQQASSLSLPRKFPETVGNEIDIGGGLCAAPLDAISLLIFSAYEQPITFESIARVEPAQAYFESVE